MTKKFQPTEKQLAKWEALTPATIPTDDEFKTRWMKAHHGKVTGWGMGKRDWVANHADDHLTCTVDYNLGLWQGRIDAMNGEPSADTSEYHTNPYHNGYYYGYESFQSFWKGFDQAARAEFEAKYKE